MEFLRTIGVMGVVFLLAFLTESMTEYIFGVLFEKVQKLTPYRWALMYVSAALGVGLAFYYALDLVSLLAGVLGESIAPSPLGFILTGLAIGRGANYLHQVVATYFPKK